ncbi:MAG: phosphoenolpyruvate synthase/pyruvate phosphate dikinase, partial [Deltaproteobacteria bacterium]|nr:phosphoenolpyruvate synthase/pyruvate phosphate dikinase [Deltaproteobacteria bacterium]
MLQEYNQIPSEFYSHLKVFHELMSNKVREILFVFSPYDAFIMEEDGSPASRIINEYSGLNLSLPPRVTRTSSAKEALSLLNKKKFDMVLTMPNIDDMDVFSLGREIKKVNPNLPVILLAHNPKEIYPFPKNKNLKGIDKSFIWSGNSDLLLALVKNAEDRLNVESDTQKAMVRVLILVEDSPVYYSSFLPLIYKEVVKQTQAVLEVGVNEEHRLLTMRARPKILLAENYEEAMELCQKFRSFLFGIISDTRIPKNGKLVDDAGYRLLLQMRKEIPDLPLLLMSSKSSNKAKADLIPAVFLDKNSPNLLEELHDFFMNYLGFGDFVFRMPDGTEIDRANDLRALEDIANVHALRKWRQKGVVAQFKSHNFDADIMDFVKIGQGSLGGKARSLAFMSALLQQNPIIYENYPEINIEIPKTLVVSTDGFDSFIKLNGLKYLATQTFKNEKITDEFLKAEMPEWLVKDLKAYLAQVKYPLSVRSSSLLEDAQFQPYAGIYETYMIPNNHPTLSKRLEHLIAAIKLVYASTYYESAKAFSRATSNQPQEEVMGVIIQQLTGQEYGDYFYPAISGVAQSHNFYPISKMKSEEGITHIALGLGKTVVEGGRTVRFSPRYPSIMPQFSMVDDILANAQRFFYALKIRNY